MMNDPSFLPRQIYGPFSTLENQITCPLLAAEVDTVLDHSACCGTRACCDAGVLTAMPVTATTPCPPPPLQASGPAS